MSVGMSVLCPMPYVSMLLPGLPVCVGLVGTSPGTGLDQSRILDLSGPILDKDRTPEDTCPDEDTCPGPVLLR